MHIYPPPLELSHRYATEVDFQIYEMEPLASYYMADDFFIPNPPLHERMLIVRCIYIFPKKNWITSRKKVNPPATTWKISNTLTRISSHREYLNPMRNLKLLENISLPPSHHKKENLNLQENEKTSLLVKVSTTLKLPQPLWKILKPSPPPLKILNFSKNPNFIGKIFNSFEVTRSIKPSPHEKILIPENLTRPFRKLQSSHAHENRN